MRYLLLFIFVLFAFPVYGQISVGHSIPLWGKTIQTAEFSYQFDRFSAHYFYNYLTEYYNVKGQVFKSKDTSTLAFSFRAIESKYINLGSVASLNKFPTYNGTNLNFLLEAKIPINRFVVSYTHISNGFGLIHEHNQGYDSISLRIKL